MQYKRYGVYFVPRPGVFARAGATWLGWDIGQGEELQSPQPEITQRPRKYGFHATMKPPFSLAPGLSVDALLIGLADLCADSQPIVIEGLDLSWIGSFIAFTARGDTKRLAGLASRVVRDLDDFRAPPSEAELERRRQARLTREQQDNLDLWGYPHVMESFRFHMTLTAPVPRDIRHQVFKDARRHFVQCRLAPFMIDTLSLVGEDPAGFFHEIQRFTLSRA